MKNRYDIVVVGAGPAGSLAALHAAKEGASVLLLEKDREIGVPVRCAEGVGSVGLAYVIDVNPRWIAKTISGAMFHSPSGRIVATKNDAVGYVLNRKIFDYDLARMAADEGADVMTKAYVHNLIHNNGHIAGVSVNHLGKNYDIEAKLVIGTDGIESRVGRWAGLSTRTAITEMESCVQVTASNIDVPDDYIHLYFGQDVAPAGYLWIFPKGDGMANVGLGISGEFSKHKPVTEYLYQFLDKNFPKAAILTTVMGGVPSTMPLKKIVSDGLLLAGDAAHQVNPLTGGGIVNAMIAGKLAGQVAGKAIAENDVSAKRLSQYNDLWNKSEGKKHKLFYKLKDYVYNLTDQEFEKIAKMLEGTPEDKLSVLTVFKKALISKPTLILDAIKVFT